MSSSKEAKKVNPINYLDLSPNAILFAKLFKDDRIYSIKNNGKVTIYRWWPAPMGNSRAPFTCALEREKKFGKDYYSGAVETRDRSLKTYQAPIVIL